MLLTERGLVLLLTESGLALQLTGSSRKHSAMDPTVSAVVKGRRGSMTFVVMTVTVTMKTQQMAEVAGHGRLMDPPARNSMWRLGFDNPVNYNDNELYCGGRMVRYFIYLGGHGRLLYIQGVVVVVVVNLV